MPDLFALKSPEFINSYREALANHLPTDAPMTGRSGRSDKRIFPTPSLHRFVASARRSLATG